MGVRGIPPIDYVSLQLSFPFEQSKGMSLIYFLMLLYQMSRDCQQNKNSIRLVCQHKKWHFVFSESGKINIWFLLKVHIYCQCLFEDNNFWKCHLSLSFYKRRYSSPKKGDKKVFHRLCGLCKEIKVIPDFFLVVKRTRKS